MEHLKVDSLSKIWKCCQLEVGETKKQEFKGDMTADICSISLLYIVEQGEFLVSHWPVMIRESVSSRTSVKSRDTMSSGLIRKRISSWTRPELVTPPPTNLLAKSTCDCRKRIETQFTILRHITFIWGIEEESGGGEGWGVSDMLFGKAAGGGGITQASVPNVTVSSSEARHFTLMLPAVNIKTRAALTSLSVHKLVNWPLTDSLWYPDQHYMGGWIRLFFYINFCVLLTQKRSEGKKKNTFHQFSWEADLTSHCFSQEATVRNMHYNLISGLTVLARWQLWSKTPCDL